MNSRPLPLALGWLCLLSNSLAYADPTAALAAQADPTQPLGLPVIVHLTITNTGPDTFSYVSGGPGRYPGAQLFSATLKSTAGRTYRTVLMDEVPVYPYTTTNMPAGNAVAIYNGQYWRMLGCDNIAINPGDVVDVPIALSPLPVGRYTVVFRSVPNLLKIDGKRVPNVYWPAMAAGPITVTVQSDPALARSRAELLREQARAGEPFAASVVGYFYVPAQKPLPRGSALTTSSRDGYNGGN